MIFYLISLYSVPSLDPQRGVLVQTAGRGEWERSSVLTPSMNYSAGSKSSWRGTCGMLCLFPLCVPWFLCASGKPTPMNRRPLRKAWNIMQKDPVGRGVSADISCSASSLGLHVKWPTPGCDTSCTKAYLGIGWSPSSLNLLALVYSWAHGWWPCVAYSNSVMRWYLYCVVALPIYMVMYRTSQAKKWVGETAVATTTVM